MNGRAGAAVAAGAALGIWAAAGAAEPAAAPAIDEIVVTASRVEMPLRGTPDIVQTIRREQIAERHPRSTGELLEYVSGTALSTGTGRGLPDRSVISLGGLPPNYTLVLVDGVRLLTDHMHTGQNVDVIPPDFIERIEIMRGAASAQYGSDAIGGIVNIVTRRGGDRPEADAGASAGNYDTFEGSAAALGPAGERVRLAAFANWKQSDGLPIRAPASRVGLMGFERLSLMGNVDADLAESSRLSASTLWTEYTSDSSGGDVESRLAMPRVEWRGTPGEDLRLYGGVAYSDWESARDERHRQLCPEAHAAWRVGGAHTLLVGADTRRTEFERSKVAPHERDDYGLFAQDEWSGERAAAMVAARYDKVEGVDAAFTPKASLLVTATDRVRLRASAGRGFHAPTLQELYEEGFGHSGRALRFGNPDLDPEYSTTFTAGVEARPADAVQLNLHAFHSDVEDMIVPVYQGPWAEDPTKDVWERTNIHSATVRGIEGEARWQAGPHARVEAGGTYSENEDESTGLRLPHSPGSSVFGRLTLLAPRVGEFRPSAFVAVRAGFDRESWNWKPAAGTPPDNPEGLTTSLEDYTKLDAGITVGIGPNWETFLVVENLLGEDIEYLDDAYTMIDGEPFGRIGVRYAFAGKE
jgi:outer membrane receptor protein involved in Fe transport